MSLESARAAITTRRHGIALALLACLTISCGGGGDPIVQPRVCTVSAVGVAPTTASIVVGATTALTATATAQNCSPVPTPVWTSGTPSVASVSAAGLVTALTPGTSTITATVGGTASGTALVTVTPAPVATIVIAPTTASVVVGATTPLTATARDAAGNTLTGRTLTWASATPTVATVSAAGVVTGVSAGTVNVTVTAEGVTAQAVITVTVPPVATVTVTATATSLLTGATTQATAVLRDASGAILTGRAVTWTSSNTAVATVSGTGLITAVGVGTAIITASAEGRSGTVGVAVQLSVATVVVTVPSPSLEVGATMTPTVVLRATDNSVLTGRTVEWLSSNAAIATVNSTTGVITAVALGAFTLTARVEGRQGVASITVAATTEDKRFAVAWIDDLNVTLNTPYVPNSFYSQNAAGGSLSATRSAVGRYQVTFGKLASAGIASYRENVFVTAYGDLGEHCRVMGWADGSLSDLVADVQCTNRLGAPTNSRFNIAVIGSSTLTAKYGFMWNPSGTASSTGPSSYSFSTQGGTILSTRSGTGAYDVNLGLTNASGTVAIVSTYDDDAACHVASWTQSSGIVSVRCTASNSATLRDSKFTSMMIEAGRAGKRWGFAWANQPSVAAGTPYAPSSFYQKQSNGQPVSITRFAAGEYQVKFTGLGTSTFGGTILVSPYGDGGVAPGTCQVVGWSNTANDLNVGVRCWSFATGAQANQMFTVLAIE